MIANTHNQQSLQILIDELIADEALRERFLRNPTEALRLARDWGLPLSETEISSLMATGPSLWDEVVEVLDDRLHAGPWN